jgi:hypothetical protein
MGAARSGLHEAVAGGLGCNATVRAEFKSSPSCAAGNGRRGDCPRSSSHTDELREDVRAIPVLHDDALVNGTVT